MRRQNLRTKTVNKNDEWEPLINGTFFPWRLQYFKGRKFCGQKFRETEKSRNFTDLSFAIFTLWRKFTEKTFAIFKDLHFFNTSNFREWLEKLSKKSFQISFFSLWLKKQYAHECKKNYTSSHPFWIFYFQSSAFKTWKKLSRFLGKVYFCAKVIFAKKNFSFNFLPGRNFRESFCL